MAGNAVELATGYVSLAVSTAGMGRQIAQGFKVADAEGAKAGASAGTEFAKGFSRNLSKSDLADKFAAEVKQASQKVADARDVEAAASRKLRIEEAKLQELRASGRAKQSQLLAGEDRLAAAQKRLTAAQRAAQGATKDLADTQDRANRELVQADEAAGRAAKGYRSLGDRIKGAFTGRRDTFKSLEDQAQKSGNRAGKRMGAGLVGAASRFAGPVAAAFAGVEFTRVFTDAIQRASDLGETQSKVNQIFGREGAAALNQFAAGSARALGQTKQSVLDAAGTFGTFGKAAGLSGQELAGFSSGFVQLSSDMASFFNTSPEDAIEAIGAALRGESEPIRRYGVLLDDASMRQEALRLGLVKTTKQALTPQQKVLAAQALIYKQTSDAQGDFARTSGGLANQQRILAAQWNELKATLGAALLPLVTRLFTYINNRAIPAIQGVVSGFRAAGRSTGVLSQYMETLQPILRTIVAEFLRRWPVIRATVESVFRSVKQVITDVLTFIRIFWSRWGKLISTLVGNTFQTIFRIISGVMKVVAGLIRTVTAVITGDWRKAGQGIGQIVRGLRDVVVGVIRGMVSSINTLTGGALTRLAQRFRDGVQAIGRIWDGLREKTKTPIRFVVNTVLENGILAAFRKIAGIVGMDGLAGRMHVSLPPGFARGGILPGHSTWRDGDSVPVMARPGEGWTVSEALDSYEKARLLALNKWTLSGRSPDEFRERWQGFARGGLVKPTRSGRINPSYPGHSGIDYYGQVGDPILAATAGRIYYTGSGHGYGNAVFEAAANGVRMVYGHMSQILARMGQVVSAGQIIGRVGYSGNVRPPGPAGAHLHFEVAPGSFGLAGNRAATFNFLNGAGVGKVGRIGEFFKAGFSSVTDWLKNLVKDPLAKLGEITGSAFGRMIAGMPNLLTEGMVNKVRGYATGTRYATPGVHPVAERGAELVLSEQQRMFAGGERVMRLVASEQPSRQVLSGRLRIVDDNGLYGYVEGVVEAVTDSRDSRSILRGKLAGV